MEKETGTNVEKCYGVSYYRDQLNSFLLLWNLTGGRRYPARPRRAPRRPSGLFHAVRRAGQG